MKVGHTVVRLDISHVTDEWSVSHVEAECLGLLGVYTVSLPLFKAVLMQYKKSTETQPQVSNS